VILVLGSLIYLFLFVESPELEDTSQNTPIVVSIEKDPWIYSGHNATNKLYWWSKSIVAKKPLNRDVLFHVLWKFLGTYSDTAPVPPHISSLINSFLATQDLRRTTLILWSDNDLKSHNTLSKYFELPNVKTRVYVPLDLAKGTPLEGRTEILDETDDLVWSDGDLFRLLVLHKYGGVYVDNDVILLRNFTPLLNQEFLYYWGTTIEPEVQMNGAVMHAFQNSSWIYLLLTELPNMCVGGWCWGRALYNRVYYLYHPNVTIFPAVMFDPDWFEDFEVDPYGGHAAYELFERNNETKSYRRDDFYDGVFAYHWHGRFSSVVEKGSKRDMLSRIHVNIVKQKMPHLQWLKYF